MRFEAAKAGFVYLVTDEPKYRELAEHFLETSIGFYEQCFTERRSVDWYDISWLHTLLAWDWLYNDLDQSKRRNYM